MLLIVERILEEVLDDLVIYIEMQLVVLVIDELFDIIESIIHSRNILQIYNFFAIRHTFFLLLLLRHKGLIGFLLFTYLYVFIYETSDFFYLVCGLV